MDKIFLVLIFIAFAIFIDAKIKQKAKKSSQPENVEASVTVADEYEPDVLITRWQFCHGCLQLVHVYATMFASQVALNKNSKQDKLAVPYIPVEHVCNTEHILGFQPFISHSCLKIFSEYPNDFRESFVKSAKLEKSSALARGQIQALKTDVCVKKFEVCPPSYLAAGETKKQLESAGKNGKTIRCEACHIIMSELNILLASVKDRSKPLMGYFEDVCRNIGFTFQPASWLENVCETIMYDKFELFEKFPEWKEKIVNPPLLLDFTINDKVCNAIFDCKRHQTDIGLSLRTNWTALESSEWLMTLPQSQLATGIGDDDLKREMDFAKKQKDPSSKIERPEL